MPVVGCSSDSNRRPGSAVVVGAGLAGLACALELERAGWRVTVLEARERTGGRVHTLREPFEGGQHGEAGGEYVDAGHTVLRSYARELNLDLEDVREGPSLAAVGLLGGDLAPLEDLVSDAVEADLDRYDEAIAELAAQVDPSDPLAGGSALDRRSAADLLDELDLDPRARLIVERSEIEDEFTVAADRLSLLFLAAVSALSADADDDDLEAFRIAGGNDRLPSALEAELRDVRLGATVDAVRHDGGRVEVSHGGGRVEADHCVLAAPLPALRRIRFEPALPAPLAGAIGSVAYGSGTKTLLQYGSRVWREEGLSGDSLTELPVGTTWETTDLQEGENGILLGYTVAERGERFGELSEPERIRAAVRDVDIIFPGSARELGATATAAWHTDPLTGGTYVAWAPGQMSAHWRALRRPHGRLHLAGEHTDEFATYMEGALRSGRRIARRLTA